jgi:hypothetical protein
MVNKGSCVHIGPPLVPFLRHMNTVHMIVLISLRDILILSSKYINASNIRKSQIRLIAPNLKAQLISCLPHPSYDTIISLLIINLS